MSITFHISALQEIVEIRYISLYTPNENINVGI